MKPEVLVLDEPTAGLDPEGRDEILGMVRRLHDENGITIILVSHSMEDVAYYADRIVVMDRGSILMNDTPKEVFKRYRELEEIGLAAPQVTYIMQRLQEKGLPVDASATTVAEAVQSVMRVFGR